MSTEPSSTEPTGTGPSSTGQPAGGPATPYVAHRRRPTPSAEELRARIPGWGADLDPADRPSFPKMQWQADSGARWEYPPEQPRDPRRERSVEHAQLTPVYGTAQPLHGLSGAVRRLAYRRYSEGRAAHWLLLIAGDRIEAWGARGRSLASARPDQPLTETGVAAEVSHHGIASRRRGSRTDTGHQMLDPVLVAGPWVAAAAGAALGVRALARAARH
ncbi:hypothetical protein [Quadrisphaera sp. KR29]|uniref:hypothetical protein n=1 Tax=Quadrisphaera sp. KR29 TaxID=3461391 RepID=UPI004043AEA5